MPSLKIENEQRHLKDFKKREIILLEISKMGHQHREGRKGIDLDLERGFQWVTTGNYF
jgi:hypothetical protein